MLNFNTQKTNVILGEKFEILYGENYIHDDICGIKFNISPESFYQVNHDQTEILYTIAKNMLKTNKNDKILDLLNGKEDLKKGIIRSLGNANDKFTEDPLRMLRAIRFACILDFDIEENTYNAIKNNYEKVSTLSPKRVKDELIKILSNKNFKKGLKLLDETKISEVLGLKYNEDITFTVDNLGMLSQIEVKQIEYTKEEKDNIAKIKEIINQNRINNFTLFNYGLYLSYVAGDVLHINKQTINKIYKNLPIKSMKDIDITGDRKSVV